MIFDEFLALRDPQRPSRRLPALVRRMLPDLEHEEGWRRFQHADIGRLTAAERRLEAWRIKTALALLDDVERAPHWLIDRVTRLQAAAA